LRYISASTLRLMVLVVVFSCWLAMIVPFIEPKWTSLSSIFNTIVKIVNLLA
jgi:hypothetical protein